MNLNRYKNELIVGFSFLLMILAFLYKNTQIISQGEQLFVIKQEVKDFKEIIALKRIWSGKGLSRKIDNLRTVVSASKVTWSKKGKKLTVGYTDLTPKELNRIMAKLMSLAVQITKLHIVKLGTNYNVECKCKW